MLGVVAALCWVQVAYVVERLNESVVVPWPITNGPEVQSAVNAGALLMVPFVR